MSTSNTFSVTVTVTVTFITTVSVPAIVEKLAFKPAVGGTKANLLTKMIFKCKEVCSMVFLIKVCVLCILITIVV